MRVYVEVYGALLEVIERPEYAVAHPKEDGCREKCPGCALAIRHDTGELVLLWRCGLNWGVSRETPDYQHHVAGVWALGQVPA